MNRLIYTYSESLESIRINNISTILTDYIAVKSINQLLLKLVMIIYY